MAPEGMRVVDVLIGTRDCLRLYIGDYVAGETVALVCAPVLLVNAEARFQIIRLSAASRLSLVLRTPHPDVIRKTAEEYDTLIEWARESILGGERAGETGPARSDAVCEDLKAAERQSLLGREVI